MFLIRIQFNLKNNSKTFLTRNKIYFLPSEKTIKVVNQPRRTRMVFRSTSFFNKLKQPLLSVLFFLFSFSQNASGAVAEIVLNSSGKEQKLLVEKASIDAEFKGNEAQVTYELYFKSKDPIAREGSFYFDVPKNAYVHDFEFLVFEKFRKSVLVPSKAGRVAYESIVRRKVDPALVEWTAGNRFKMRIFPIRSGQPVAVRIVLAIPATSLTPNFLLNIPSDFQVSAENQNAKVELGFSGELWTNSLPKIASVGWKDFLESDSGYFDSLFGDDTFEVSGSKTTTLGKLPKSFRVVAKGSFDAQTPAYERKMQSLFFLSTVKPKLPQKKMRKKRNLLLFWDVSLSESKRKEKNFAVLKKYMEKRGTRNVIIYPFAHKVMGKSVYRNTNFAKIAKALNSAVYDGATRIAPLLQYMQTKLPKSSKEKFDVLVMSNLVDSFELQDLSSAKRILSNQYRATIVVPDSGANEAYLKYTSKRLGAPVYTHSDILSGANLNNEAWVIDRVSSISGNFDLVTIPSHTLLPGQSIQVLGKGNEFSEGISGHLYLTSQSGKKKKIKWQFDPDDAESHSDDFVSRRWAKERMDRLLSEKQRYKKEIKELSIAHQLMSPYVVRVVLETCRDYRQFNLPVPDDCEERARPNLRGDDYGLEEEDSYGEYVDDAGEQSDQDEEFAGEDMGGEEYDSDSDVPLADAALESDLNYSGDFDPADSYGVNEYMDEGPGRSVSRKKYNVANRKPFPFELQLKGATNMKSLYAAYLKSRAQYSGVMYLYVLTAQLFYQKFKKKNIAERILSNVVELRPGEARWLRVYGYLMAEMGHRKEFLAINEAIIRLREEEPQSYRDLALELERLGKFSKALELFKKVEQGNWDNRLYGIKKIAKLDTHRVAHKILSSKKRRGANHPTLKPLADQYKPDALIVTVSWDADNTDVNLHIHEPGGAHVHSHNLRPNNATGRISFNSREGYGPEQYRSPGLDRGAYKIGLSFHSESAFVAKDGVFATVQVETRIGGRYKSFSKLVHLKDRWEYSPVWTFQSPVQSIHSPNHYLNQISYARRQMKLKQYRKAYQHLMKLPKGRTTELESRRLFDLARATRHVLGPAKAIKLSMESLKLNNRNSAALYNAACFASLANQISLANTLLNRFRNQSRYFLKRKRTYYYKLIATDPDLNRVRNSPSFKKLVNVLAH